MAGFTGRPDTSLNQSFPNDGFWPAVSVREFVEGHRVPSEYQDALIIQVVQSAIIKTNDDLSACKSAMVSAGFVDLAAYMLANPDEIGKAEPADSGFAGVLDVLYHEAVFNLAKAKVLRRFQTIDQRKAANNEAKTSPDTEAYFLDEYQQAISGISRRVLGGVCVEDHGVFVALI